MTRTPSLLAKGGIVIIDASDKPDSAGRLRRPRRAIDQEPTITVPLGPR